MWTNVLNLLGRTPVCIGIYLVVCCAVLGVSGCGGVIKPGTGYFNGTISSPNYPNRYPDGANCIWLFETSLQYQVTLVIGPVAAQNVTTGNVTVCNDYVEVRDGSSVSNLLYHGCHSTNFTRITSPFRWLWVKFFSDRHTNNIGFIASWETVHNSSITNNASPIPVCPTTKYFCPNFECISWAFACDTQNDCGCLVDGCDEIGCGGLDMPNLTRVAMGIAVGTAAFLILFSLIGGYEAYMFSKARNDRIKEHAPKRALYQMKVGNSSPRDDIPPSQAPTVPKHPSYEEKVPVIKTVESEEEVS